MTATLLCAGLVAPLLWPLSAWADYSKCTAKIRASGYFILDIDSDWDRPYDKFSAIKSGREYDIWVDKDACKIQHIQLDGDRRWYDD